MCSDRKALLLVASPPCKQTGYHYFRNLGEQLKLLKVVLLQVNTEFCYKTRCLSFIKEAYFQFKQKHILTSFILQQLFLENAEHTLRTLDDWNAKVC